MQMKLTLRRLYFGTLAAVATLALAAPLPAAAQTWPNKPIRLLVGFAPGGGTDIVARALAPKMSEVLGQTIVIENRSGASGTIAADMVARAPADGYTLLAGHSNSNAIAPFVLPKLPYDAGTDFTPITYIGFVPNVLVTHPSVQANNVAELIALTKKKPGGYTFASSGIGSTQHVAGELFERIAGVFLVHIPYRGSGAAVADLLAGNVNMNFDTMPPVLPHIRAGTLRALAISTPQRIAQLPEVPTFEEVGIKGFDVTNWYSVMGPKGMPADVVARINEAVLKAMDDPGVRKTLEGQGVQFGSLRTPAAFSKFLADELAKYRKLIKELDIKAE
jgi:tripartite-type tricarboxylate transporter receptor subunit TctC